MFHQCFWKQSPYPPQGGALTLQLAMTVPELDDTGSDHQYRVAAGCSCNKDMSRVLPDETARECARQAILQCMTDT
jgi:hypothetical protein